ncbi:MAG: sensor histidine kinase, partial [Burkholderiales bacterium]|nr:sensor histidine kinase [Opitutaceae bacterium]
SFARVEHTFGQQARFTSDASHELRTPISVILTESQLALKRERSAAEYRESLVVCCETAGKMKHLVDDLLLLARSDARALQANRSACDLSALADSVRRLLEPLAEERGLRLRHAAAPAPTQGDAAQLERILVNLVMNAVQHSPAGAEIVIETATEDGLAVARVIDPGRGIPAEALPHIFDRFYRVDPSRARTEGGAGLGLAISQGIAESHGGRIEAQSEPGVRTVFTLRLPSA